MDEQDLYAALRNRQPVRRSFGCPGEETLAAYADSRLEPAQRPKLERHLSECGFCREQIATLVRLADQPPGPVSPELIKRATLTVVVTRKPPAWKWALPAAVAACALLALVPALRRETVQPQATAPSPRAVRNTRAPGSSTLISFPSEGAIVSLQDLEFRWSSVEAALFYEVRILGAEGDPVWTARAERNSIRIPPGALQANRKYYLSVSAYLSQEQPVKLPMVGFQTSL